MQKNPSKKNLMAGGNKKKVCLCFGKKGNKENSSNPNPVLEDNNSLASIESSPSINNSQSHVCANSPNHESKSMVEETSHKIESCHPSPQTRSPSPPIIESSSPHQERVSQENPTSCSIQ